MRILPIAASTSASGGGQPALAAPDAPAGLEGPKGTSQGAAQLAAPRQGSGHMVANVAEEGTPHERAVVALIDAVDRHPDEALGTLRHWLKSGAREELAA